MKIFAITASLVLAFTTIVALAPAASAVDMCKTYQVCVPNPMPDGCTVNGLAVRANTCDKSVAVCSADYYGGGGGGILGNFVWTCRTVYDAPDNCNVNGLAVRADACAGRVQTCWAQYYGGGGGKTPLDNIVWKCDDLLS